MAKGLAQKKTEGADAAFSRSKESSQMISVASFTAGVPELAMMASEQPVADQGRDQDQHGLAPDGDGGAGDVPAPLVAGGEVLHRGLR